ncbi:hypothetical protein [Marinitoga lauensis]|uniref:hypothetical protein n=1 Tax=Marinitoga lauensis TaxID=2201189 RepID=UPI001011148E|nr:hypothetical protein [Marinitoga lauensis]
MGKKKKNKNHLTFSIDRDDATNLKPKNKDLLRIVDDYNDLHNLIEEVSKPNILAVTSDIALGFAFSLLTFNINKTFSLFKNNWDFVLALALIVYKIVIHILSKNKLSHIKLKSDSLGKSIWQYEPKKILIDSENTTALSANQNV